MSAESFSGWVVGTLLTFSILPGQLRGDDWPHWMGPQHDNVWREAGVIESFPAEGPAIVWRTPVAGGYAGPAVAGGRVFVTDYVTSDDVKVDNFNRSTSRGS
ncbi:MAG: hypothetical protein B7Z55_19985, partial [Planctomycetales bacterium 12-60-4]